ncbi:zinc-ribbon domain-containing protein [Evansella caseinilytica]|uniref:Zinc-ribbon domain-containing protein n=1 Tax=Evansella caseinilytica TaxID=1503961 RepID=A0A1H3QWM1_9BACI|nr:zinc ribbon domain-containing protein [Evansella caseinilytica]SDZ17944.1 zinc-ribbon domain-containing protein [Evansella caseinilytica]
MNCLNCGNELQSVDKFCIKCGTMVEREDETAATAAVHHASGDGQNQNAGGATNQQPGTGNTKSAEFIEEARKTSKHYWNFFLEMIKAPTVRAFNNTSNDFIYGYINIFVLALFLGLGMYFQARAAMAGVSSYFGVSVSFVDTFFPMFLYSAISTFVLAALLFAGLKLLLKVNISFHACLGRFGALLSIPVILSAAYLIFAFTGLQMMIILLLMLVLVGVQIALILSLFSYRKQATAAFDPIFTLLVIYAVYGILFGGTADIFRDNLMNQFFLF